MSVTKYVPRIDLARAKSNIGQLASPVSAAEKAERDPWWREPDATLILFPCTQQEFHVAG